MSGATRFATRAVASLAAAAALLLTVPRAYADEHGSTTDPHAHHRAMKAPTGAETQAVTGLRLPAVEVVDHEGRAQPFADLVPDGQVVINFIFTTCTTICPPMGAGFGKLQQLLDERGADTRLLSISVDPTVDTPERLAAWGERFGRGERWTLVTGDKRQIDRLLKALRVFTPDKIDHAPIVLLGDTRNGRWLRAHGLAAPNQLLTSLDELAPRLASARQEEPR